MSGEIIKTLKIRIKDKHAAVLGQMAREVNTVWNFCNELSQRVILEKRQFLSGYDLQKYTTGYCLCDGVMVPADTVNQVCIEYAARRSQLRLNRLNWRVSNPASAKHSLGWVPFKARQVRFRGGQVVFRGHQFSLWDSYGLGDYEMLAGSFSQDSRARWYFNVAVSAEARPSAGTTAVGLDLGLKTAVTASTGQQIEGRLFRAAEAKLAIAQRAGKRRQARTLHAKVRNQRKDLLHKFSTKLVKENAAIFVGDVSSAKLVKTKMAKSTLDAGWATFKNMLEYKSHQAGIVFEVVNESYSTQTCSQCGSIEGPKGVAGLGIREWACSCGAAHSRDVNAARNILRAGLSTLEVGVPAWAVQGVSLGVMRGEQTKGGETGAIRAGRKGGV